MKCTTAESFNTNKEGLIERVGFIGRRQGQISCVLIFNKATDRALKERVINSRLSRQVCI